VVVRETRELNGGRHRAHLANLVGSIGDAGSVVFYAAPREVTIIRHAWAPFRLRRYSELLVSGSQVRALVRPPPTLFSCGVKETLAVRSTCQNMRAGFFVCAVSAVEYVPNSLNLSPCLCI
jgi:hypothetical protein